MATSHRPLKLHDWGISWEEYKELTYFCLQYEQKKREAAALLTIRISTPPPEIYYTEETVTLMNGQEKKIKRKHGTLMPHGSGHVSDPVAATAAKRDRVLRDVRMIEQAARDASKDDKGDVVIDPQYILRAVTTRDGTRKTLASMQVPMGERQFYAVRRKFFWILREIRNMYLEQV